MYVCILPTFLKNYWTELHEIFRDDLSSSKDQSIRFWEQSGQRSRSRSQKGQKHIFVIKRCFRPIHVKPTPKCSLFDSLSSDLVTCGIGKGIRSTKWFVCMYVSYVTNFSQKPLNRIA